jgi:hypothetical protein
MGLVNEKKALGDEVPEAGFTLKGIGLTLHLFAISRSFRL